MARGQLRVYLGSAPGVGKTYKMLDEGWRRRERGTDVVIAYVETHGRTLTDAQIRDLEIVPRVIRHYRGSEFAEMDLDAVLARKPEVALVDEFAHTNVPGGAHEKRWQDVETLLDAGINVITTVNIQHLESVNDVVEKITGIAQQETVPDAIVRKAEQIELVDITPEALRRRMAHGNIYSADKVDASLSNYFRSGNLTALRELALLWLADRVEDSLQRYLEEHDINATWETRERLVVALTGTDTDETLLRRAARIASRSGAELIAVHVVSGVDIRVVDVDMSHARELVNELDGRFEEIVDDDIASALVAFARSERGTQIVMGASRPKSWARLTNGVVENVLRRARDLDVHIIAVGGTRPEKTTRRRTKRHFSLRRQVLALLATVVVMVLLNIVMTQLRSSLSLSTVSLIYLIAVLVLTTVGGPVVAIVAALGAAGLENYYFVRPLHTLAVARPDDVVSLVAFLAFAIVASVAVSRFAQRSREAERARAEAEILAIAAATVGTTHEDLLPLLDSLRAVFDLASVALLVRDGPEWTPTLVSGAHVDSSSTDTRFEIDDDHALILFDAKLDAQDRLLVNAFVERVASGLRLQNVQRDARELTQRVEADALRIGLLHAVSNDLRKPLAAIQANVASLQLNTVTRDRAEEEQLLSSIEHDVLRLTRLVANLVDAGRLEAGVIVPHYVDVSLGDLVATALRSIDTRGRDVNLDAPDPAATMSTDPKLAERIIANVVSNACRFGPIDRPVRVHAVVNDTGLELLVIDRGPGIAPAQRAAILEPFHRLGNEAAGIGLGLTVVSGFVQLLGGELRFEDTPGGGLTVVIELPNGTAPTGVIDSTSTPDSVIAPAGE